MRTMLILIFICSLAQFAIAERTVKITIQGCGTIYACYVPKWCIDETIPTIDAPNPQHDNGITMVEKTTEVFDDCPAVFKFHRYAKHWVHVWIESFADVKTITFLLMHDDMVTKTRKTELSCTKKTDGTMEGSWKGGNLWKGFKEKNPTKFACEFIVKLMRNEEVIQVTSDDWIHIEVEDMNGIKITPQASNPIFKMPGCDPSNLEFKKEIIDKREVYRKVKDDTSEPGKFYCEDIPPNKQYKMEYRKKTAKEYTPIEDFKCLMNFHKFAIENAQISGTIDIRCKAEARYFCENVPNHVQKEGTQPVDRVQSDPSTNTASELKCPPTHPHMYVKGKPIVNKKLECLNYGGEPSWALDEIPLNEEVHCEEKIKCELLLKIAGSSVLAGRIDNYVPVCAEKGTLKVDGVEITKPQCNPNTGDFTYDIVGGKLNEIVTEHTKFVCEYPKDNTEAEKQNAENLQIFTGGSIVAGVIVLVILTVIIIGSIFFTRWRLKKERMEAEAINNAAFLKYGTGKQEKKQDLKKKKQMPLPKQAAITDDNNLNPLMMSVRYEGVHVLKTGDAKGEKCNTWATDPCPLPEERTPKGPERKVKNAPNKKAKDGWLPDKTGAMFKYLTSTYKEIQTETKAVRAAREQNEKASQKKKQ